MDKNRYAYTFIKEEKYIQGITKPYTKYEKQMTKQAHINTYILINTPKKDM